MENKFKCKNYHNGFCKSWSRNCKDVKSCRANDCDNCIYLTPRRNIECKRCSNNKYKKAQYSYLVDRDLTIMREMYNKINTYFIDKLDSDIAIAYHRHHFMISYEILQKTIYKHFIPKKYTELYEKFKKE